jgi:hypothetical protein
MPDPTLFTDSQVHELGAAVLGGLALIGAAIRAGFKRYSQSFDEMTAAFKTVGEKLSANTETLVRVETITQEGRADMREVRDAILKPRRSGRHVVPEPT